MNVLEQALGASALRGKVISNNMANFNTPGFKKSEVIFESLLQNAMSPNKIQMQQTNEKHLPMQMGDIPSPLINVVGNTSLRNDGNNVDIDVEMAESAKNNIYYNAIVSQINNYFSSIKSAINEGRR